VRLFLGMMALLMSSLAQVAVAQDGATRTDKQHRHGVKLAREGKHEEGLAILKSLLDKQPKLYPIRRDYIIILTWKGDCDAALENYQLIRQRPNPESYLISAVSECLVKVRDIDQARSLLRQGLSAEPDDNELATQYQSILNNISLNAKPRLDISIGTSESEEGNRDHFLEARYSRALTQRTRGYARFFNTRSADKAFETGDLNRLGLGALHWFNHQWLLDQEFSKEIRHDGDAGSRTRLSYYPTSLWELGAEYASFAEDIPLRAKAENIDTDRFTLSASFHTFDYRWEWFGSTSRYDFSDTNNRNTLFTSGGYAYQLEEKRERRLILELFHSRNTKEGTVYYNPSKDLGLTLVHRTDFVLDTRYQRHVDHLSFSLGTYNQAGFSTKPTYGVRYEQDYDFSAFTSLSWGIGLASRIYDGGRESQTSFVISISSKLI